MHRQRDKGGGELAHRSVYLDGCIGEARAPYGVNCRRQFAEWRLDGGVMVRFCKRILFGNGKYDTNMETFILSRKPAGSSRDSIRVSVIVYRMGK